MRVLDVGCGLSKEPGAVGIDRHALPDVDITCDLDERWPLGDGSFDRVVFRHSLVHLSSLEAALREARRVCRFGGVVEVITPHFSSDNAFTDPTMKFFTGYRTLDYYCAEGATRYGYYGDVGLRIVRRRIEVYRTEPKTAKQKAIAFFLSPLNGLINMFPRAYEKFFCFLFRANEVHFVLKAT